MDITTPEECLSVLELPLDATEKQIKSAYKRLAHKYHPDKNPNNKLAEYRFRLVDEAYKSLLDPNFHLAHKNSLPPKPVAEPTSLDFGEVYEDSVAKLKLTVHNHGGKVKTPPALAVIDINPWFSYQEVSSQSADEGYCPFEIEITAHGRLLKGRKQTDEWVEIVLDGVKTCVNLQARLRSREPESKPKPQQPATRTITFSTGQETKPPKTSFEQQSRPPEDKAKARKASPEPAVRETPQVERATRKPPVPEPQKRKPPPSVDLSHFESKSPVATVLGYLLAGVIILFEVLLFCIKKPLTWRLVGIGLVLCGVVVVFSKCGAMLDYLQRNTPGQVEQRERAQEVKSSTSSGQPEKRSKRERNTNPINETSSSQPNASKPVDKSATDRASNELLPPVEQSPASTPSPQTEVVQLPHRLSAEQCAERKAARRRGEHPYIPPECNEP